MATITTSSDPPSKVLRINDEEKTVLSQLRKLYVTDYRNYCKHIKNEPNIPVSVKKVYNSLDKRQAYRRIADYFHRERMIIQGKHQKLHVLKKPYRSTNCSITQVQQSMTDEKLEYESDNSYNSHHEQSNNATVETNSGTVIDNQLLIDDDNDDEDHGEDDINDGNISETNSIRLETHTLRTNGEESIMTRTSHSSTNLKSNLLSVHTNIQKALHELDRVLLNSDRINEQQFVLNKNSSIANGQGQRKLDDIIRSLSNAVNQQQDNVRSIINESSVFLADENKRLENVSILKQESLKNVMERLNNLVDRSNSIFDKVEKILSQF